MARTTSADDLGDTLALAIVESSQAPLLLLDGDFRVLAASETFCQQFDLNRESLIGKPIFKAGTGQWDLPRLRSLLSAVASGDADVESYEIDLVGDNQTLSHLMLAARRLQFEGPGRQRLMLTIIDVTSARAAEKLRQNLLREKDILLQEVQHRVANSLQIIASVLLQNARKVQSEETRGHLRDAHLRVMSVASVQKQLSASRLGDVLLKPYFDQLCQSLSASMIRNHSERRIDVTGDGSATSAAISVSLGLIVTELVINALKHAFPGERPGVILVDYHSDRAGWVLSVCDNGVGMPKGTAAAKPGLGTAIVEALASQLNANITVTDLNPGTAVAVVHADKALAVVHPISATSAV